MNIYQMMDQKIRKAKAFIEAENNRVFSNPFTLNYYKGYLKAVKEIKEYAIVKPTESQLIAIERIHDTLGIKFEGETKTEAYLFIDKYMDKSKEVAYGKSNG